MSFALWSAAAIVRGPSPERTYTSPGGVPTTVLASQVDYSLHLTCIAVSVGVLLTLTNRSIRREFRLGLPSSPPQTAAPINNPALPLPIRSTPVSAIREIPAATLAEKHRSQRRALLAAIFGLAILAAAMGWLVQRGLTTGETMSPTKRANQSRSVSRTHEPVLFWVLPQSLLSHRPRHPQPLRLGHPRSQPLFARASYAPPVTQSVPPPPQTTDSFRSRATK